MEKNPKIIIPAEESVFDDYIVCLFDGTKRKMMHRHVAAKYGMTWDEYKTYCRLPADYPAVAPGYAREKIDYARGIGIGTGEPKVAVEIPRFLRDKLTPMAVNEGLTMDEFVTHLLTEHLLAIESGDGNTE
jgi:predicted transcriptional regulator